jgi:hypothetical protein
VVTTTFEQAILVRIWRILRPAREQAGFRKHYQTARINFTR